MVKSDDYSLSIVDIKDEKEAAIGEDGDTDLNMMNWIPQRSKSVEFKCLPEYDESDEGDSSRSTGKLKINNLPNADLDDRRLRRQIANCNERRRMQSINAGFQALRQLLPRKDGDKMSKASILAATAEFIQALLKDRSKMLEENGLSAAKRRRLDAGEQNGSPVAEEIPLGGSGTQGCLKTINELRDLLQKETQLRMAYERELMELRNRMCPGTSLPSPLSLSDFSPNSSLSSSSVQAVDRQQKLVQTSAAAGRGLLIEMAAGQQLSEGTGRLYRPVPIAAAPAVGTPADVSILTSAIASLAKSSTSGHHHQTLMNNPIGIQQTQNGHILGTAGDFIAGGQCSSRHPHSIFAGLAQQAQQQLQTSAVPSTAKEHMEMGNGGANQQATAAQQASSLSQQNLQALVLAIRQLEGASNAPPNGNNLLVR